MLIVLSKYMKKISIIDSHTGGEPTRLILDGGPELGVGTLAERMLCFQRDHDRIRSAVVCEPRGSDVLVGALACVPYDSSCEAGVIFFNNAGYLGMCGHGMIGFITSLAYLGRIRVGRHRIETPVGIVGTELHDDGSVTVYNVPAYRFQKNIIVEVDGYGSISGDVAWGGNWFFLVGQHGQNLQIGNIEALTDFSWRVRQALERSGVTGEHGAIIDHIELFAASVTEGVNSRNFVLCPGRAYDRSPCGTGTSAKLACLAADHLLAEGEIWRQESITGSVFEASYQRIGELGKQVLPRIRARAHVTAEATLLLDESDPLVWGIR